MIKIHTPADFYILDIASAFTRPLSAYLNRPLIKILEDLGIRKEVFLKLQDAMLKDLRNPTGSWELACRILDDSTGTGVRPGWDHRSTLSLRY